MKLTTIKEYGQFTCNISHLNTLCLLVAQQPATVYELIRQFGGVDDTVTREAIFSYITDKYNGGDYNKIYLAWLGHEVPA